MSMIFYLAKEELDKYLKENQDKTDEIMKKFITVEDVVKDGLTNVEKVDLISNIYQENVSLSTYARTHCEHGGKQHVRFMAKFFKKKRKLIFRILESIKLFSATQDEGVTRSLEFMLAHKRSRKPVIETFTKTKKRSDLILMDVKWVEPKWWKLVTGQKKRESFPETIRREHFEVCLCDALAMSLRCGDIYVLGSLDYNDYRKELLPLSECEKTVAKYGEIINLPVEKEAFIAYVKKLLILKSEETDIKFPDNNDFTFKDGVFHLKRLIARTATQRNEDDDIFQGRINELKLIDALTDTAHWISWHKVFGPHSGHQAKIKDELSRYVAMTFSYGTGLGPKEGSKMLFGFTADQIADTDKNHSTCEKIDRAIFKVIEAYNKLHLPRAAWGTGKNIGADGTHWILSEHNSFSQRHVRYGQWGGIAYYHVADNYIAIFSKFIPCGVYEAVHILDGVFSQLKQERPDVLHGDTHAQNAVVFGLSFLLGIKLMPRIRTWHDLKLYKASKEYSYKHIEDLFTKDNINWELIQKHLPDMLQVAQSIMAGVIKPSTVLRRLGTANQKSKLFQAFNMLGRVIRTITLLEYVSDKELRHIVQGATSKCEQFNKFAKWLHFAQDFIKQNKRDEQQKIIKYNHLIAVLLTFHNAYSMTEALVEMEKEGIKIPAETISSISPYRTRHVRRFGEFQVSEEATKILDLNLKPIVTDELLRKATIRK